jgi:hypothetical protein
MFGKTRLSKKKFMYRGRHTAASGQTKVCSAVPN